jgi:hypothetical protein
MQARLVITGTTLNIARINAARASTEKRDV